MIERIIRKMYTKKEQYAFDVLKGQGFHGLTYNNFCYGCRKFYGRCDGIKDKSNFPCVNYVPEKDMDKVKYEMAKDMMYQMDKLYDGKKHGVLVMSLVLSEGSKKVKRVVDYKVIHESTFDKAIICTNELKKDYKHWCMCVLLSMDGKELETHPGRNEILLKKTDKDYSEDFKRIGFDLSEI